MELAGFSRHAEETASDKLQLKEKKKKALSHSVE
jgi:hypothetical protein